LALFERLYINYDYGRSPRCSSGKGYKSFEQAWNIEAADRYRRFAEGEEVQLIKRKTVDLLKQQYDRMQEQLGTAARADEATRQMNSMDQSFNRMLRDNRSRLPVLPTPTNAVPVEYQQQGHMPFGNPFPLNAEIAAGRLQINPPRGATPYVLTNPNALFNPMEQFGNDPARGFRKTKYCVKCGWPKRYHNRHNPKLKFGHDCTHKVCGKCFEMARYHPKKGNYDMGIYCLKEEAHELCVGNVQGWYTAQHT